VTRQKTSEIYKCISAYLSQYPPFSTHTQFSLVQMPSWSHGSNILLSSSEQSERWREEKRRKEEEREWGRGGEGRRWQRRGIETRDYTIRERRGRVGKVENEGWSVRRREEGLNATTKKAGQEKQANARQGRARQGRAGQEMTRPSLLTFASVVWHRHLFLLLDCDAKKDKQGEIRYKER
jgi:hypothetical protein